MDIKMKERLDTILQRCTYLEKMMELPAVASDFQRYKMYAKEHSNLEEVANAYKEYKEKIIKQVAQDEYNKGNIIKECYDAMMKYEVEITD